MAKKISYYQDKEEPGSLFKMDWETNTGYGWHYGIKDWVEYEPVMDYVMDPQNLRVISEETLKKEIRKYSRG